MEGGNRIYKILTFVFFVIIVFESYCFYRYYDSVQQKMEESHSAVKEWKEKCERSDSVQQNKHVEPSRYVYKDYKGVIHSDLDCYVLYKYREKDKAVGVKRIPFAELNINQFDCCTCCMTDSAYRSTCMKVCLEKRRKEFDEQKNN